MERQIATNRLQSDRLLQCGVPAESADMCLINGTLTLESYREAKSPIDGFMHDYEIAPAWSLGALLGLLPKEIYDENGDSYFFSLAKEFPLSEEFGAAYIPCWDKGDAIIRKRDNCPIEACVQLIEWLTENNYKLNEQ